MGTAVLADRQLEEMAAAQTACDVENHISLTVETVAGISGHALSGQNGRNYHEHCVQHGLHGVYADAAG